jgi:hypothetical protein
MMLHIYTSRDYVLGLEVFFRVFDARIFWTVRTCIGCVCADVHWKAKVIGSTVLASLVLCFKLFFWERLKHWTP